MKKLLQQRVKKRNMETITLAVVDYMVDKATFQMMCHFMIRCGAESPGIEKIQRCAAVFLKYV
ncbi:MAG: hypothetical protein R2874_00935 [Desulfobacterales bacterium]